MLTTVNKSSKHLENVNKSWKLLNKQYKLQLNELSMGMSGDFKIAIEEGINIDSSWFTFIW